MDPAIVPCLTDPVSPGVCVCVALLQLIRLQGPSRGRSQVVPSKQPLGHTEGATHAKEAKLMVPNEVMPSSSHLELRAQSAEHVGASACVPVGCRFMWVLKSAGRGCARMGDQHSHVTA